MTLRPRATTLLAAAVGLLLGACGGSLYDAAGVPKVDVGGQQCNADQHLCPATGNVCQAQDATHCGDACLVCPDPGNGGAPACVASGATWGCGFSCTAPTRQCGGQCLAESVTACGSSCLDCRALAPAGTTATCVPGAAGNECAYACQAGFFPCSAASGCCAPTAVAAGGHQSCAVTSDGGLDCWGDNGLGQLGRAGPGGFSARPVTGMTSGVTMVAVGGSHACAVKDGTVWCWGSDAQGQLGDGAADSSGPTPVSTGLTGATQLVAGTSHTCALVAGGVRCWGANDLGQAGVGSSGAGARVTAPPAGPIPGLSGVTQLAAGGDTTCALAGTDVRCWGANGSGQTGSGDTAPQASPAARVPLAAAATTIAVGGGHACAGVTGSGLFCWGANESGQLGSGAVTAPPSPWQLAPVASIKIDNGTTTFAITAGAAFTCGAKDNTELICNGRNDLYQSASALSTANVLDRATGVALGGGALVHAASGLEHSCLLVHQATTGDEVRCWGRNAEGQLGRDTTGQPSADALVIPPAP